MASEPRKLTTTSYALLGLIAVQPFTTYELAQQMERSLADYWPRAQSVLYREAKNLVAHGLAATERTYTGRRASTIYLITPEGRQALRSWLDVPGEAPVLQWEALVQVAFADHGSLGQLRNTLTAIRADADQTRDQRNERGVEYLESGGPFPDRLPTIALVAKYLIEHAALVSRWAAWVHESIETWDGLTTTDGAQAPEDAFRSTWVT